jgi:Dockerin type I domain
MLVGHVIWQGPPAQPNARQALPISMTLQLESGGPIHEYASLNTDSSGVFTATGDVASGSYYWWVKGPKYLASSGSVALTRGVTSTIEVGSLKVGDCNGDNAISVVDFSIIKGTFGKTQGDPGYDARADLNADNLVTAVDVTLEKTNFGQAGAPPVRRVAP